MLTTGTVFPSGLLSQESCRAVGYHDLEGHTGFKMALAERGGRWFLYLCYHRRGGWAVLEVTDPTRPVLLRNLPFDPSIMTNQIQVAGDRMITALQHFHPAIGAEPSDPTQEGVLLWDLTDPEDPQRLAHWRTGALGTHRNFYAGGRHLHCAATRHGYAGQVYVVVDLEADGGPREVGHWALQEQRTAGAAEWAFYLHGGPYVVGNRAYLPYGSAGLVILDIEDVTAPSLVSRLDVGPALGGGIGVHSAVPIPSRSLVVVNSEPHLEDAQEAAAAFAAIVDIGDESTPRITSFIPGPTVPEKAPYRTFAHRGGRYGIHNQHQHQGQPHLADEPNTLYANWYSAGLRRYDISDPYAPIETGHILPGDPRERRYRHPSALVYQGQDVVVDARGYAYFTEMNSGLYIAQFTD